MNSFWNLNIINYFIKIVECKNISNAARELYITQPTLTHQIQAIEQQLGFQLYTRAKRGVEITERGMLFYKECKKLMAAYQAFESAAAELSNNTVGTLRIGYPKAAEDVIIDIHLEFFKNYPNVKIKNVRQSNTSLLHALSTGDIDFFYVHEADLEEASSDIKSIYVNRKPFMVLMSADNPLACKKVIHFSELSDQHFVLPSREHANGRVSLFFRHCQKNGFVPNITNYYYQSTDYNIEILTVPNTVTIQCKLPKIESDYHGRLVYVPLEGYTEYDNIHLAWSTKHANALTSLYIRTVRDVINAQIH